MRISTTAKWIYGLSQAVIAMSILLIACIGIFFGWLMLEPREIPEITSRLEQYLNQEKTPFVLKVQKTMLALGDFRAPLDVIIHDATLVNREGEEIFSVPVIHFSLSIWDLLMGRVTPKKVSLMDAKLHILQDKQGVFFLSDREKQHPIPLKKLFASDTQTANAEESALLGEDIDELSIVSGNILFESELQHLKLTIPAANLMIRQNKGLYRGRLEVKALRQGFADAALNAYFTYEPKTLELFSRVNVSQLNLADYAEIASELAFLKEVNLPLSGSIELQAVLPAQLKKLSVNLNAEEGSFRVPPYLPQKSTIRQLHIKAVASDLQHLKLEHLALKFKGISEIAASGAWSMNAEGKQAVEGKLTVHQMSKKRLMRLWPEMVSSLTRKWVDESIIQGEIADADFILNVPFGGLDQLPLPDDAVQGKVSLIKGEIDYAKGFPHTKNSEGELTLTGNTVNLLIHKAEMLDGSSLTEQGKVTIPDLAAEEMPIAIELPFKTTAADALTFLKSTSFKPSQELKFNPATVAGNLTGTATLHILDKPSPAEDEVKFTVNGKLQQFSQPALFKGMDVRSANGTLTLSDSKGVFDGAGLLAGQPLELTATQTATSEQYHIKTTVTDEKLHNLGLSVAPYLTGTMGVVLDLQQTGKTKQFDAKIDLTPAALQIEKIAYLKPIGNRASLTLKGTSEEPRYHITQFSLNIPNRSEHAEGSAEIIADNAQPFQTVKFSHFNIAGSEGSGEYRALPKGHYIHASGKTLDLSFRDTGGEEKANTPAKPKARSEWDDVPALDVALQFDTVKLSKDGSRMVHQFNAKAQCDGTIFSHMNITGNAGNNKTAPFHIKIEQQNNHRVFSASSPNAGAFLYALDIFDDMRGGDLTVTGLFQDELASHPLIGNVVIGSHRVQNVKTLTKLLTVATFTGIVDSLSGEGLMFQKLVVPFKKENGVLHIHEAKSVGPSIGITADGTIDLNQDTMRLRGVVVPAYMFNAIIRSIPIVGNVFGVLAGDGLVAMRYSMIGALENPDVTGNPLSVLTPGFLRGFFSIFEESDSKTDSRAADTTAQDLERLEGDLNKIKAPSLPSAPSDQSPASTPIPIPTPTTEKPKNLPSPITTESFGNAAEKRRRQFRFKE
jgi:hypothetical protein